MIQAWQAEGYLRLSVTFFAEKNIKIRRAGAVRVGPRMLLKNWRKAALESPSLTAHRLGPCCHTARRREFHCPLKIHVQKGIHFHNADKIHQGANKRETLIPMTNL